MKYHAYSTAGDERDYNQDRIRIVINEYGGVESYDKINYYAIYDGHGDGNYVPDFLYKNCHKYFKEFIANHSDEHIKNICDLIQEKIIDKDKNGNDAYVSGSTALIVIKYSKIISNVKHEFFKIINIGDCRVISCNYDNNVMQMSSDHTPIWDNKRIEEINKKMTKKKKKLINLDVIDDCDYEEDETNEHITKKFLMTWRIGSLSVARSFGDLDHVPYVTHEPEINEVALKSCKFVIMGCDGLWDTVNNDEAVMFVNDYLSGEQEKIEKYKQAFENFNFLKKHPKNKITKHNNKISYPSLSDIYSSKNLAEKLAYYAIAKGSYDNVSVIIIFCNDDMVNENFETSDGSC
jgi:protein phosphatase 2C